MTVNAAGSMRAHGLFGFSRHLHSGLLGDVAACNHHNSARSCINHGVATCDGQPLEIISSRLVLEDRADRSAFVTHRDFRPCSEWLQRYHESVLESALVIVTRAEL